jgi:gliding motility-associated-like protein
MVGRSKSNISGEKSEDSRGQFDYWILKFDVTGNLVWDKTLGGDRDEEAWDITVLSNGKLLVTGRSWTRFISGDKTQDNYNGMSNNPDHWMVLMDTNGVKIWDRHFGSNNYEIVCRAVETPAKNIILVGATAADTLFGGIMYDVSDPPIGGSHDTWLLEIDTLGNKIWDNRLGSAASDDSWAIAADGAGAYLTIGSCQGPPSFDITGTDQGGLDAMVFKVDGLGSKIWDKRYGSNGDEFLGEILALPGNEFLLCGYSDGDASGDKSQSSRGGTDFWIIKIDGSGNILWETTLGGSQDEYAEKALLACDGNLVIIGTSKSPISGDKTTARKGLYDFWVVKLDQNGNKLWDATVGGTGDEFGNDIAQIHDGTYLLAGDSESGITGDKTEPSRGMADYWIANLVVRAEFVAPDTVCAGQTVTFRDSSTVITEQWNWNFGDPASGQLNTSSAPSPLHAYLQPGTYTVTQIVTEGCQSDTVSHTVTVMEVPVATPGNDTLICFGDAISIGAAPTVGWTYDWSPTTGLNASNLAQPQFLGPTSTSFTLVVRNWECEDQDTISIEVVSAAAGADTFICVPDTIALQAQYSGSFTAQWFPPINILNANSLIPEVFPSNAQTYYLTATAGNCVILDTLTVLASPPPVASFIVAPSETEFGLPVTFVNSSQFSSNFTWDFGDGSAGDSAFSPVHAYSQDGEYVIYLTASNALGCTDTASGEIVISTLGNLFIPTAFTPNGDGLNDVFEVFGVEVVEYEISIYGRGGQQCFYSTDIHASWDGFFKNQPAPEGNYAYVIKAKMEDSGIVTRSGSIMLIR